MWKSKTFLIFYFILLLASSCNHGTSADISEKRIEISEEASGISFEKETHDFGRLISGERVSYGFRFSNTGTAPLLITGVRSGCGCTVGDYPKQPLLPGEQGKIDVVFNSTGKKGYQVETVRVMTNATDEVIALRIQAEVVEH